MLLGREAAFARLLRDAEAGILFNEHLAIALPNFVHACQPGAKGIRATEGRLS
jgi:hypothetical protein